MELAVIPERLCVLLRSLLLQELTQSDDAHGPTSGIVWSERGLGQLAVCRYFDSLKRQALATSLTPSNVPSQLMYQFSLSSSSELGLLLACVPCIHFVSLL